MDAFICVDMWQPMRYGFRILLPASYLFRVFGDNLKLSHIAVVPQEHRMMRLILTLLGKPNEVTPSLKDTTDREVAPDSMEFGRAFPHTL